MISLMKKRQQKILKYWPFPISDVTTNFNFEMLVILDWDDEPNCKSRAALIVKPKVNFPTSASAKRSFP